MSNDSLPSEPAGRRRGWLFPALIASLALNLIIVGGIGTKMLMHKHGFGHHKHSRGWEGFVRKLPDERRALLEKELDQLREDVKPLRSNVDNAWQTANKKLGAADFTRDNFYSELEKVVTAHGEFKTNLYGSLADIAAKMTPEERAKLSEWRHKRHERRQRWRKKKHRDE